MYVCIYVCIARLELSRVRLFCDIGRSTAAAGAFCHTMQNRIGDLYICICISTYIYLYLCVCIYVCIARLELSHVRLFCCRSLNRCCRSLSPHYAKSLRSFIYMYMHIYVFILISLCVYICMYSEVWVDACSSVLLQVVQPPLPEPFATLCKIASEPRTVEEVTE